MVIKTKNNLLNNFKLDCLGRIILSDKILLEKINGAIVNDESLFNLATDSFCNGTCNSNCPRPNYDGCHNTNCGC